MNVNRTLARIMVPILLLLGLAYFYAANNKGMFKGDNEKTLNYSQFLEAINGNNVVDGSFDKDTFEGHLTARNQLFTVYLGPDNPQQREYLNEQLAEHGVKNFGYTKPVISDNVTAMVVSVVLPLGVIFVFWMFFLRQAQRSGVPGP